MNHGEYFIFTQECHNYEFRFIYSMRLLVSAEELRAIKFAMPIERSLYGQWFS